MQLYLITCVLASIAHAFVETNTIRFAPRGSPSRPRSPSPPSFRIQNSFNSEDSTPHLGRSAYSGSLAGQQPRNLGGSASSGSLSTQPRLARAIGYQHGQGAFVSNDVSLYSGQNKLHTGIRSKYVKGSTVATLAQSSSNGASFITASGYGSVAAHVHNQGDSLACISCNVPGHPIQRFWVHPGRSLGLDVQNNPPYHDPARITVQRPGSGTSAVVASNVPRDSKPGS